MLLPPVPAEADIVAGLLVLLRVSSMVLFLPVLGHQLVPTQAKIGMISILTLLMFPMVRGTLPEMDMSPLLLGLMAGQELLIGGMIALLAQLMFGAIQMAGQVMSYQMGMAIANVFDPSTSAQIAIVGQIAVVLAMLLWLAVGAHHAMILSLADSFTLFPMGHAWSIHGWDTLNAAAANLFSLSIRLSAPILLLMMLTYAALGLLSRAVPQIQIFFVSFPLTISLGLIVFALSLPAFISLIGDNFKTFATQIPLFLHALAGG